MKAATVLTTVGGVIFTLTTAIAVATGAFTGKASLWPYLVGYGIGAMAFVAAYLMHDERPCVSPVRYGAAPTSAKQINGKWCRADGTPFSTEEILSAKHLLGYSGLIVDNNCDDAWEVYVTGGTVGDSTPTFDNRIQRLTKNMGEGFFPINILQAHGGGLLGGLFEEMRTKDVKTLPLTIWYKNGKGHRYKTTCNIVRDVRAVHGLSIEGVHHGRDWLAFLRSKQKP